MRGGFDQWWAQLGGKPFTPDDNRRIEARMRKGKNARERYWAWILRTSWGNHELYCCKWMGKDVDNPPALNQTDAADTLGLSRNTISKLTLEGIKEGTLQADANGRIVPTADPKEVIVVDPPKDKAYAAIRQQFFVHFPQLIEKLDTIRATKEKARAEEREIETLFRRYWKRARSGDTPQTPVTDGLFDSGDNSEIDSGDNLSPTPVTPPEASDTPSLDSRTRDFKLKQEETSEIIPVSELVVESPAPAETTHSLTEIAHEISELFGAPPKELRDSHDPIPGELLAVAQELKAPVERLCQWIREWGQEKRAANYPLKSRRLIVKAAKAGDFALWLRNRAGPRLATAASATPARDTQPREATPEEIAEHKARGTYVPPKRR